MLECRQIASYVIVGIQRLIKVNIIAFSQIGKLMVDINDYGYRIETPRFCWYLVVGHVLHVTWLWHCEANIPVFKAQHALRFLTEHYIFCLRTEYLHYFAEMKHFMLWMLIICRVCPNNALRNVLTVSPHPYDIGIGTFARVPLATKPHTNVLHPPFYILFKGWYLYSHHNMTPMAV